MASTRLAFFAVLVAANASAGEVDGALRAWLGTGFDSNAFRDFVVAGARTYPDAALQGLLQLDGAARFERGSLTGGYDVGGRKFLRFPSEDTLVQNAALEGELSLLRGLSLGATFHGRDRRGADRDYTDLGAEGFVRFTPEGRLDARLFGGAHRFLYWPGFTSSHFGPTFGFSARYRLARRHSLSTFLSYEPRTFNDAEADTDPNDPAPAPRGVRKDSHVAVGLGYAYRGPFALGVGYAFVESASNGYGQSWRRHRLTVNAGVALPWKVSVLGLVALQYLQYPDGIHLSEELTVVDDDETQNQVSLKLVRPLGEYFEVDLRWQFFFNWMIKNQLEYQRHTVTLGFAFRLPGS